MSFSRLETWLPVIGFEGFYEVSSAGRVRSLSRVTIGEIHGKPCERRQGGKVLQPQPVGKGYLAVKLSKGGRSQQRYVHHLVAMAFIGSRPAGMEVAHNDGVKANCAVSNLRYDTPTGNNADKLKHGTNSRGEANASAKLTAMQVRLIRACLGAVPQREIAERFGVKQVTISNIKRGKIWSHIEG